MRSAGFILPGENLDTTQSTGTLYEWARNESNLSLVKVVLTAALYPSVARIGPPAGRSSRPVLVTRTETVQTHPSSVNARLDSRDLRGYLIFLEKVQTTQVFLRDTTSISHFPLLLFGGTSLRINHGNGHLAIVESDGSTWLQFRGNFTIIILF